MDKRYEPLIIEEKWSELWAKNSLGKNNSSENFSKTERSGNEKMWASSAISAARNLIG